jgi:hypothetical protein
MSRSRDLSKLTDEGAIRLPTHTSSTRPPSEAGLFGYNSTSGGIEFYNAKDGQWSALGVIDGASPSSAFSSVDQVAGLYTGVQELYTTFGGRTTGTKVVVDFDTAGGPWIRVSFAFTTGGITTNGSVKTSWGFADDGTNGAYGSSARYADTGNLGLGEGTQRIDEVFYTSPINSITSDSTFTGWGGIVLPATSGRISGPHTINYWNHATLSEFTPTEKSAMQDWVTNLCPLIPHVAQETDSQNLATNSAWNSQSGPQYTAGHELWWQDKDGFWQRMTARDNATDESTSMYAYTESTYSYALFGGGSLSSNGSGTPTGLFTTKMILPESVTLTTGTGGGLHCGTPYISTFSGGAGNISNGRMYFLIKG